MEVVINIPEETYKSIKHGMRFRDDVEAIMTQIENGTPLPKGHGRLIDGDVLKNQNCCSESYVKLFTIVEADKEANK